MNWNGRGAIWRCVVALAGHVARVELHRPPRNYVSVGLLRAEQSPQVKTEDFAEGVRAVSERRAGKFKGL